MYVHARHSSCGASSCRGPSSTLPGSCTSKVSARQRWEVSRRVWCAASLTPCYHCSPQATQRRGSPGFGRRAPLGSLGLCCGSSRWYSGTCASSASPRRPRRSSRPHVQPEKFTASSSPPGCRWLVSRTTTCLHPLHVVVGDFRDHHVTTSWSRS